MRYPDDIVEEVRSRTDIVDMISGYVRLKRQGSSFMGLCPFHNEKTPSFSVSPSKQMYYCFGCGAGGNVYTFLMNYENYTFQEAITQLAARCGVTLPEPEMSREAKELSDKKSRLMEINKAAAKYYYSRLRTPSAAHAMNYLKKRGLTDETMRKFGLGYADRYSNELYRYLKNENYSDDLLRESGLFNFDEKRGMTDKFWNRVIFPIMDRNSHVIGFGGRVMGDALPKYLNSPETAVFDKSRNLYGLHAARNSRRGYLILCEGYMDVISMHQAGFTNAVASLGTSLTSQQAALLKRYTNEVVVIYDSDEAGTRAALRAIPMLRAAGLSCRKADLSPHKDPDEFINALGREAFEERLASAENGFFFEVRVLQANYDLRDPQKKTEFFRETAKMLMTFEEEMERNNYKNAVAEEFMIPEDFLQKEITRLAMKGVTVRPEREFTPERTGKASAVKDKGIREAQRIILSGIAEDPAVCKVLSRYLTPDDFPTPLYRKMAEIIFVQAASGQVNAAQALNSFENGEEQSEAAAVFHGLDGFEDDAERDKALVDAMCLLREKTVNDALASPDYPDMTRIMTLMNQKKELEEIRSGKRKIDLHVG